MKYVIFKHKGGLKAVAFLDEVLSHNSVACPEDFTVYSAGSCTRENGHLVISDHPSFTLRIGPKEGDNFLLLAALRR